MKASTLACACALLALALAACDDHAPAPAPAASTTHESAARAGLAASAAASASAAGQPVVPGGQADRLAPPVVPPVVRDGVAYAQAEDGRKVGMSQSSGVLVASDAGNGKRLWALAVYPAAVDPKQEADVQWLFFKSMAFDPQGRLRIVNEANGAFLVDVKRHTVSPAP